MGDYHHHIALNTSRGAELRHLLRDIWPASLRDSLCDEVHLAEGGVAGFEAWLSYRRLS
jgi:hypothetical protein